VRGGFGAEKSGRRPSGGAHLHCAALV
jgi:hypothetical protein